VRYSIDSCGFFSECLSFGSARHPVDPLLFHGIAMHFGMQDFLPYSRFPYNREAKMRMKLGA
jgi:hypothetical protein